MASYASILDTYNEVQSPLDINLINTVMGAKQGMYDRNLAEVDQVLSELGNVENLLVRSKDKAIFAENLRGIVDTINRSGKVEWSNSGFARDVKNQIRGVLDNDYLIQQIGNSQTIRDFGAQMEAKKKNDKSAYSAVNHSDALMMSGIESYMQEGVDEISTPIYHDYVDVTKTATEKIKDFIAVRGEEVVERMMVDEYGVPRKVTRKIKGMTADEIMTYVPNLLSAEEREQLAINGRARYKQDPSKALSDFEDYRTRRLENVEKNIASRQAHLKNPNVADREAIEAELDALKVQKEKLEKQEGVFGDNGFLAASHLEQDNWLINLSQALHTKIQQTSVADLSVYDVRLKELQAAKLERELEKLNQESTSSPDFSIEFRPDGSGENIVGVTDVVTKSFNQSIEDIKSTVNNTVSKQSPEVQASFNAFKDDAIKRGVPASLAEIEAFEKSGLSKVAPDEYNRLLELKTKRHNLGVAKEDSSKKAEREAFAKNAKTIFGNLTSEFTSLSRELQSLETLVGGDNSVAANRTRQRFKEAQDAASKITTFLSKEAGITLQDYTPERLKSFFEGLITLVSPASLKGTEETFSKEIKDSLNFINDPKKYDELVKLIQNFEKVNPLYTKEILAPIKRDKKAIQDRILAEGNYMDVATSKVATLTNEKQREAIVNAIPQDVVSAQGFSAKKPISIRQNADNSFTVFQLGEKGAEISYQTNAETGGNIYESINTAFKKEAIKTQARSTQGVVLESRKVEMFTDITDPQYSKNAQFVGANSAQFRTAHPATFLSKQGFRDAFSQNLQVKFPKEVIEQYTEKILNNLDKFRVVAEPNPDTGRFQVALKLYSGNNFATVAQPVDTGLVEVNKQLITNVVQYPQTFIGDQMIMFLLNASPEKIKNTFDKLN